MMVPPPPTSRSMNPSATQDLDEMCEYRSACGGGKGGGWTTWGVKGKDLFLLHVLRRRMEYPELKRAVCEQCEAFGATVVLIEDKASGTQLIQELVQQGLHAITRYQPQTDKIMRMHAQTAMIENGFVHLPKDAAWLPEYLHELTVFPKGKHDDQVDSTAQMLDWLKQSGREPGGFFQLVKESALELRRSQPGSGPPVRLRAPPGISAVQLLSGTRRTVGAVGTVEISESNAAPLLGCATRKIEHVPFAFSAKPPAPFARSPQNSKVCRDDVGEDARAMRISATCTAVWIWEVDAD
jgi:predicted phage terminase large subunit-like protein